MSNFAVTLDGIKKRFGRNIVLNGISGKIEKGSVVGLLGRNGEGKTTLMRILLDILAADEGRISVLDDSPNGSRTILRKVGYIPERPSFHDFMSVKDVLQLRSRFFPSWNWEKAKSMLQQLELDQETRIKGASKGTLAKIAWICATAHNPEILLLDEPTSGLDALVRDSVLTQLVTELTEEGKTIFVANHRMEELLGVLDEVWVLANGSIQTIHPIDRLRQNAWRITGRVRSGTVIPSSISVYQEQRTGDVIQWSVIDEHSAEQIRTGSFIESMEMEPLPLETAFKLLLLQKGVEPC